MRLHLNKKEKKAKHGEICLWFSPMVAISRRIAVQDSLGKTTKLY
jgi:hypothetical protein